MHREAAIETRESERGLGRQPSLTIQALRRSVILSGNEGFLPPGRGFSVGTPKILRLTAQDDVVPPARDDPTVGYSRREGRGGLSRRICARASVCSVNVRRNSWWPSGCATKYK